MHLNFKHLSAVISFGLLAAACSQNYEPRQSVITQGESLQIPQQCNDFVSNKRLVHSQTTKPTYSTRIEFEDLNLHAQIQDSLKRKKVFIATVERATDDGRLTDPKSNTPIYSGSGIVNIDTNQVTVTVPSIKFTKPGIHLLKLKGAAPWGGKTQSYRLIKEDEIVASGDFTMTQTGGRPLKTNTWVIPIKADAGEYHLEIIAKDGYAYFDSIDIPDNPSVLDARSSAEYFHFSRDMHGNFTTQLTYNFNKLVKVEIDQKEVAASLQEDCRTLEISRDELLELNNGKHTLSTIFDKGNNATTNLYISDKVEVPSDYIYEAEIANKGDGIQLVLDDTAKGGQAMYIGDSGFVSFNVHVSADGAYPLVIRYKSNGAGAVNQKLKVNGKYEHVGIGGNGTLNGETNQWKNINTYVVLNKGVNHIAFEHRSGNMAIDYIKVKDELISKRPYIQPKEQSFYKANEQSVRIKVEPYNNGKARLMLNGKEVPTKTLDGIMETEDYGNMNVIYNSYWLEVEADTYKELPEGTLKAELQFENGVIEPVTLRVRPVDYKETAAITLIVFNVRHGQALLMQLPDGQNILVDAAKAHEFEGSVLPFLIENKIQLDEIWISHNHGDHYGGLAKAKEVYPDAKVYHGTPLDLPGYHTHWNHKCEVGTHTDMYQLMGNHHGAHFRMLNNFGDRCTNDYMDENKNSLSYMLEYKGVDKQGKLNGQTFRFYQTADIYGEEMDAIEQEQNGDSQADVFLSNHHFHGSISVDAVKKVNPDLLLTSASPQVYRTGAYNSKGLPLIDWLRENNSEWRNSLETFNTGTQIIKVYQDASWTYESFWQNRTQDAEGKLSKTGEVGQQKTAAVNSRNKQFKNNY